MLFKFLEHYKSPAPDKKLNQLLEVIIIQQLLQLWHLSLYIVASLDLGGVHIQICDDAPHICKLPRLHKELGPDFIGVS